VGRRVGISQVEVYEKVVILKGLLLKYIKQTHLVTVTLLSFIRHYMKMTRRLPQNMGQL